MEKFLLRSQPNERKRYFLTEKQYLYYKESTDNVSIIGNKKITKALTDSGVESRTNEFDTYLPWNNV